MYKNGRGVVQDDGEAVRLFRLSAEQGNANGQNNLGVMYKNGRGVVQDDGEAVRLFRLSAEQGNAAGQHNLGVMYKNGRGVVQDDGEQVQRQRDSVVPTPEVLWWQAGAVVAALAVVLAAVTVPWNGTVFEEKEGGAPAAEMSSSRNTPTNAAPVAPRAPEPTPAGSSAEVGTGRSGSSSRRAGQGLQGTTAADRDGGAEPALTSPADIEEGLGLDRSALREIQRGLEAERFNPGAPDGLFGPGTRGALRRWQSGNNLPATGYLTALDASALRAVAPPRLESPPPPPPPPFPPSGAEGLSMGTVAGVVTDDTFGTLPGVTVEASSDVLVERARVVFTNAVGRYAIIDLTPGVYTVKFTLPGFFTQVYENLTLGAGDTRWVDPVLEAAGNRGTATQRVINERLDRTDSIRETGAYVDRWSIDVAAGDRFELSVVSDDFDTYLRLRSNFEEIVDEDDDGGGGTDSRIETIAAYTGHYLVEVTSYASGETGNYTLRLTTH